MEIQELKCRVAENLNMSMEMVEDLLKLNTKQLNQTQYRHYHAHEDKEAKAYGDLIALKMMGY